mgnify:CR=1 FL=1
MVRIEGGNMHNAIPREATALVRVASGEVARFESALEAYAGYVKAGVLPALVAELKG